MSTAVELTIQAISAVVQTVPSEPTWRGCNPVGNDERCQGRAARFAGGVCLCARRRRHDRLAAGLFGSLAQGSCTEGGRSATTPGRVLQPAREHRHHQFRGQAPISRFFRTGGVRAGPDLRRHDGRATHGLWPAGRTACGAWTPEQARTASRLVQNPKVSARQTCVTLDVLRSTLHWYGGPCGELRWILGSLLFSAFLPTCAKICCGRTVSVLWLTYPFEVVNVARFLTCRLSVWQ